MWVTNHVLSLIEFSNTGTGIKICGCCKGPKGKSAATKTGSCCRDKEGAQKTINK